MRYLLYSAWLIALAGCAVSFYYGEILWIEPCRLCWYQRMALFPLALILGIAIYRNESVPLRYVWPFIVLGGIAAFSQALAIHVPAAQLFCGQECIEPIFSLFNAITFPDLSAAGFLAIAILLYMDRKAKAS